MMTCQLLLLFERLEVGAQFVRGVGVVKDQQPAWLPGEPAERSSKGGFPLVSGNVAILAESLKIGFQKTCTFGPKPPDAGILILPVDGELESQLGFTTSSHAMERHRQMGCGCVAKGQGLVESGQLCLPAGKMVAHQIPCKAKISLARFID